MYSRKHDPMGCQALGYRLAGIMVIVAAGIWIVQRLFQWLG